MDVIHTAIWVSDMDEAKSFFVDGLGLQERWSFTMDGVENVYVGGDHGEIQLRSSDEHPEPIPERTTLDHIAVSTEDTDGKTEAVIAETGCAVLDGPRTIDAANARVAFIEGPDGYVIELVEDLT